MTYSPLSDPGGLPGSRGACRVTRPRPGGGRRGEAKRPFEFPSRPQAKVVVVSDDDHQLLRAAGAVGYVLKENLLEVRGCCNQPRQKKVITSYR